ncbi:MAG: exo-alpha-sialidase [Anaerolineae bacterium]|nr:exo-alpha-sialidase [Anaerolineae bacterium]
MIQKFTVARDDEIYEAFPDVALTHGGRLVCVFAECTHHVDRSYTCIMYTVSEDRGRTWAPKRPLTEPLHGDPRRDPYWNCPRISTLSDGRLVVVVDRIAGRNEGVGGEQSNWLWFSADEGESWEGPYETPIYGIVPDRVVELRQGPYRGRWLVSAHTVLQTPQGPLWAERCWASDDAGQTWRGPFTIASERGLLLCEGSALELPGGELVCFLRENSGQGLDAFKALSYDGGEHWEGPYRMPMPACHRPVAGMLQSGRVMITHRYMQGGSRGMGWRTQNLFAALTDVPSCLAREREQAHTRILPLDYDRSPASDTGYSGWVQFPDGELYVVNYLLDDAPKAYIRGYALREEDFLLEAPQ